MKPLSYWHGRVQTSDELIEFVKDVGFCTISRLEELPAFPSQDDAMGREDSLGPTWFWKDDLHIEKRLLYTRIFRKRPGYLSLDWVPAFIATNGRPADELIYTGKMSAAAREIYEIVERRGATSSVELADLLTSDTKKAKNTALIDLERRFILTKVGLTGRDMWSYGYIWDLAERWMFPAFEEADKIGEIPAAKRIVERLREFGLDVAPKMLTWLLGWEPRLASAAI